MLQFLVIAYLFLSFAARIMQTVFSSYDPMKSFDIIAPIDLGLLLKLAGTKVCYLI